VLAAIGKIVGVPAGPAWVWLATRIGRRNRLEPRVALRCVGRRRFVHPVGADQLELGRRPQNPASRS
jgi:hypothetical protein